MPPPHCTRPSNLSKLNYATFTPLYQHNPTTVCLLMQQLWGLSYETGQFRYFTKNLKALSWENCLLRATQGTACHGAMISAARLHVHAKLRESHVMVVLSQFQRPAHFHTAEVLSTSLNSTPENCLHEHRGILKNNL